MRNQLTEQPDPAYLKLVEDYSQFLPSPAQRLRFLRSALERYHRNPVAERLWLLRQLAFRKTVIEELVQHLPSSGPRPIGVRFIYWLYRIRYPVYFTAVLLLVVVTAVTMRWVGQRLVELATFSPATPTVVVIERPAEITKPESTDLPGYPSAKIWLVERTGEYEQYSNGCRILTEYEIFTERREYYAFRRSPTKKNPRFPVGVQRLKLYPERMQRPVGILYHVTQSDLVPFTSKFNYSLRRHTKALLEYIRQEKLYNYLIDRFGRIYRIVRDEDYANHAGNSLWADSDAIYINLNQSFIGVAFEGWWEAGVKVNPDEISPAQIHAAKMLTEVLRSKFNISDTNCVTHGLVSVNPTSYLIGHHMDWATDFPFKELGLKDKYLEPTPSISEFAFGYDKAFREAVGNKLWPGIALAEARLKAEAADLKIPLGELKRQLQHDFAVYRQWQKDMRGQDNDESAEGQKPHSEQD